MLRIILSLFFSAFLVSVNASPVKVSKIEPSNWYVGMKDPTLQLMVYGENIRETDVTTDYPGVRIDSVARLGSPNYLLVYLNLEGARPGTMSLKFTARKEQRVSSDNVMSWNYFEHSASERVKGSQTVSYVLKEREMSGDKRIGFTNADVLYMLMPDRFAQGKNHPKHISGMNTYREDRTQPSLRHGGDIEGIRQHLDYFNELGVTALWLTPVLENNAPDNAAGYSTYHGYATTDYYRVDPRFGTNEDYRKLTDEAHQKGLKVVMDMIFNHCGFNHPWVKDVPSANWFNAQESIEEADYDDIIDHSKQTGKREKSRMGAGDFDDAYVGKAKTYLQTSYKLTPVRDPYASEVDKRETVEGWFVSTMPDLNHHNPHAMKYLIQNSIWWIETIGINGIRMDTYPYAFGDAMAQWMKTLNEEYPNFNVVGETWVTEPAYTASWQKDSPITKSSKSNAQSSESNTYLPCVMDFSFFDKLSQAKNEETDPWWSGLNRIYNSFVYDFLYVNPDNVMAFIDNHDTDRFLGNGSDSLMLKQALAMLLTVRRIPQIYYGTEILMNGTKEVTDGNVRKDFPGGFPGDTHNAFTSEGRTPAENAMFNWLSRLLHWRKGNDIVTRGTMKQFIPYNGVYVIARQLDNHGVIVLLNGTTEDKTVNTMRYSELYKRDDKLSDGEYMRLENLYDKRRSFTQEMQQYKKPVDGKMGRTNFIWSKYNPAYLNTTDVITGKSVKFGGVMTLGPRETLILEY